MDLNKISTYRQLILRNLPGLLAILLFQNISAQVTSSIDSTSIRIGEQITYKIEVNSNPEDLVVFPEGETFSPLEMVESLQPDTIRKQENYKLLKEYFLTQFDSGKYVIPSQEVLIQNRTYRTDSFAIEVKDVIVDTTKQNLYPLKPSVTVSPGFSIPDWLWWLLAILAIAGAAVYLIVRKRKSDDKVRELPPYEEAMVQLKQLDSSGLLENREIREYYSQLSFAVRKYLDRKIYDHGLERTTGELILYLQAQRESGKLNLNEETIRNFEKILNRADLAKFARSKPDIITAKDDRTKTQLIIDDLRAAVPQPTQEELLQDEEYLEAQRKKRKKRRIILGVLVGAAIVIIGVTTLIATKGITYVMDTYIGHPTKELLEGEWIRSEYGNPSVAVTTPKVLVRGEIEMPEDVQRMMVGSETFIYGSLLSNFYSAVTTIKFQGEVQFDLQKAVDGIYTNLEAQGATNIVMKQEEFTTLNGAKGLKVFGTLRAQNPVTGEAIPNKYVILNFAEKGGFEQIIVIFNEDDTYAEEISQRIINSVEINNLKE
ncbi:BatD family protein [uncultured Christiangramia sp.]|uniref:BatD family protein n=1 Tax=uncultured Christiangramia sp. TaxID=503836 RepID=UPI0025D52364|nr:BatD family protein [uncultured Christiangramia sp.]|tara:strand:+ start:487 stop:2118 length:1632 start_codon:yes stop_codon:yes gene_type:complete